MGGARFREKKKKKLKKGLKQRNCSRGQQGLEGIAGNASVVRGYTSGRGLGGFGLVVLMLMPCTEQSQ